MSGNDMPPVQPSAEVDEEQDDGVVSEMSNEYSDDDDPGYRIVLVEEVGELYPDYQYVARKRKEHGLSSSRVPVVAAPTETPPPLEASAAAGEKDSEDAVEVANSDVGVDTPASKDESGNGDGEEGPAVGEGEAEGGGAGVGGSDDAAGGSGGVEGEDGVEEEALAAHHMPDLIENQQPMFQLSDGTGDKEKSDKSSKTDKTAKAAPSTTENSKATQPDASAVETPSEAESTPVPTVPAPVIGGAKAPGNAIKPAPLPNMKPAGDGSDVNDDTVYYDCFDLKIVYERNRTGFEETKDYPIDINGVIAGRYQILEFLGAAAFSKAVQCVDLTDGSYVCIKIIKNNKDFFDQSLDEIKILKYINAHDSRDEHHLLQLYDYFYFKEHLFIVTELLRDNLYEFSKFNRESGTESYFTMARLQKITKECLVGLKFVHGLGLIHCDLKPENILIRSYSRCEIKVIDFGSSCFVTDHLTSYVQSRSYRAPEVILGLPYDQQIDLWSLGCILAELWTGRVLFQNDSLATLLARVVGILGPIEEPLLLQGRYTHRFFTKHKILYDRLAGAGDEDKSLVYIFPKKTTLKHRLGTDDALFVDFVSKLLTVNPSKRYSAAQALEHPWLTASY